MGLFENKNAKENPGENKCPNCGGTLVKDATFCHHCGKTVGGCICKNCGASLPADANFCPKCKCDLRTSKIGKLVKPHQDDFSGKHEWIRDSGDFARKFEVEDLRGIFKKTVTVAEGTRALLLQGGAYVGDLKAGHYNIGKISEVLLRLNLDDRATVILVDDGIVPVDFSFDKTQVRTADSTKVGVSGILTLKNSDSKKFIRNLLKGKNRILLSDLQSDITYDLLSVVQATLHKYEMDRLYGNLDIKKDIEQQVRTDVAPTLESYGFDVERLRFLQYDESEWENIIEKRGTRTRTVAGEELDIDTKQKIRRLLSDDKINALSTEDSVAAYVHELATTRLIRTSEIEDLKIKIYNNREDREFIRNLVMEKAKQISRIDIEDAEKVHGRKWRKINREDDFGEVADLIKLDEMRRDAKNRDLERQQKLQLEKQEKEAEIERKRLEGLGNATPEARMFLAEGETAELLAEHEKWKIAVSLNPEKILALNAKDPIAAAEAMKEQFGFENMKRLYESRLEDQQKFAQMMEKSFGENADRMTEVLTKALDSMGSTATARSSAHQAQGSTVVAGGGIGQPVVVNPVQPENIRERTNNKSGKDTPPVNSSERDPNEG